MGAEVVYALQLLRWHACFSVVEASPGFPAEALWLKHGFELAK